MPTTAPALPTIDILDLIQSRANIQLAGRPNNSKDGREYHSNCPWCGGKDRFSLWPETGRWSCKTRSSGCGRWGDALGFLMQWDGITYHQACQELDSDPRYPSEGRALPLFMTKDTEPVAKWMDAAEAFVWRAERYLWSPGGIKAQLYLQSRGLHPDILKQSRIGYCPGWYGDSLENWGLLPIQTDSEADSKIPQGIVIPWFVEKKIWKIQVKRFEDPEMGYFQVLGSSDALYGIDEIQPGKPIMLLEGEFDKLSVEQEAGDIITAIATGGASKGQSARWIAKLKTASSVLIGFDGSKFEKDASGAGDNGANQWLKKLPNSIRWTPWAHDANEMLQKHISLRAWVEMGLKSVQTIIEPAPIPEPVQAPALIIQPVERSTPARQGQKQEWQRCRTCGQLAIAWKNSEGYCRECCPWREELRPAKPMIACRFCSGKQICKGRHKKHIRARWIWFEADHEWICNNCYSPARWTHS